MDFPDVYTSDFRAEKFKLAKEAIDYAITEFNSSQSLRRAFQKVYDSYNGIVNPKEHESLTKPFGIQSKNEYTHYNFGLNKVKTLVGEFLSTDIDPRVETVDEDKVNEKFEKYLERKAMLELKPQINEARQNGYDVLPGMAEQMEDPETFLSPENFKTENERLLTKYLKNKIKSDRLKTKFKTNLIDVINTCVVVGKIDTVNGTDTYRPISPMNAMFFDSDGDGLLEDSPYVGEKRSLHYHQIIKEFNVGEKEVDVRKRLKELGGYGDQTDLLSDNQTRRYRGQLIDTYTMEFKTIADVSYFKIPHDSTAIIREIPSDEYNRRRKKYDKEVLNGEYEIVKVIHEEVWEITRIGADIYRNIRKTVRQSNRLENKKLRANYNYIVMLVDTVEGQRIPLQHVISKLDKAYNDTMFLINRELRKPSGSALGINMGFLPRKVSYNQIMTELIDEGTLRFNTAAEGNQWNIDGRNENALTGVNIGDKARVIEVLIRLKMDIENAVDRITGISRGRVGMEMATTTATTSNNNLETSRTVTYDIFYYLKEFIDEVMTRMVDKGKLNFIENNPDLFGGIYAEDEFNFLMATREIALDQFTAYINDGRKELVVRQKIEGLFQSDINNGMLRTKDVANFYLKETLAEGLRVLDNAWEEINKIKEQSEQSAQKTQLEAKQMDKEMMEDNREDLQAHDLEKVRLQGEMRQEEIMLQKGLDADIENMDNTSKERIAERKLARNDRKDAQMKNQGQANRKK